MLRADPFIDADVSDRSASVIQIESLGKGGIAYLLFAGLLSVIIAMFAWSLAARAMDKANMAERESRIVRDELDRLQVELKVSTNH